MTRSVFVAGATGAIGAPLVRLLVEAGWCVQGSTRRTDRAAALRQAGVEPFLVDVLDASALCAALAAARPDVVVHQLTDLPAVRTPEAMSAAIGRNALLRKVGTRTLVAATLAAGCRRMVAQSITWAYADGPLPHMEDDPLDTAATEERAVSVEAVRVLESLVLDTRGLAGTVLRYGRLYGPGTWAVDPPAEMPLHVHDAAYATLLAMGRPGATGAFNVSEPCPLLAGEKAGQVLGWAPGFRLPERTALCSP